jgi:hypothetical protein
MEAVFVSKTPHIIPNQLFPYPGAHKLLFGQYLKGFSDYHPNRAGCLLYSYCENDGHFYFYWTVGGSNNMLGDFGGGITVKENTVDGALRECLEESAGVFGFNVFDVYSKSFILYSEELALIFIPVHQSFIQSIKAKFARNLSFYRQKMEMMEEYFNKNKFIDHDSIINFRNNDNEICNVAFEIEVLRSMNEKHDVEIIRDDIMFDHLEKGLRYNDKPFYYLIVDLLIRSKSLLKRNLSRYPISVINVPYQKLLTTSKRTMSNKRTRQVESRIVDKISTGL